MDLAMECFNELNTKKLDKAEHQLLKRLIWPSNTRQPSLAAGVGPNWTKRSTFNSHNEINNFRNALGHFNDTVLQLEDNINITCLSWSTDYKFLAFGCDNGRVKVIKLKNSTGLDTSRTISIKKDQTLDGHTSSVQFISWNEAQNSFSTCDLDGVIITWKLSRNGWYKELVNAKRSNSNSVVRGLAWSSSIHGDRICIIYEDGSIVLGSADRTQLWCKEIKESIPSGVIWSPDGIQLLIAVNSGDILVYSHDGEYQSKIRLDNFYIYGRNYPKKQTIVNLRWFHGTTTVAIKVPYLAVVLEFNHLYLFRGINDTKPIIKETKLVACCGDWSPNGDYFAIAGKQLDGEKKHEVIIFTAAGQKLLSLEVHSQTLSSLAWDSSSLRLAIGSGSAIYFADIRPNYKSTFSAGKILVYTFGRVDGSTNIAFWDIGNFQLQTQEIPGLVIDLKGNDQHCAILTCNRLGNYYVILVNVEGAPVCTIPIIRLEPFILTLTENVICCIAENAVLVWKYQMLTELNMRGPGADCVGFGRRECSFHLDDPGNIVKEPSTTAWQQQLPTDYLAKPTLSPATCADAVNHLLVIMRETGIAMFFSLPHPEHLITVDYNLSVMPLRALINKDGSQTAFLYNNGGFSICYTGGLKPSITNKAPLLATYDRKNIWDFIWCKDNPELFCFMEKSQLFVSEMGKVHPPVNSCGNLVDYHALKVTSILMDEIIQKPDTPSQNMIQTYETKPLSDMKLLIDHNVKLSKILKFIEEETINNHPILWKLLAKAALLLLSQNFDIAEMAFVKCKDYSGIQLVKKLGNISNIDLQQAEIACFYEEYEQAEEFYLKADKPDLAIQMWKILGNWERVGKINDSAYSHRNSQEDINNNLGDYYAEEFQWKLARLHYEKSNNIERMLDCCVMLEDYEQIQDIVIKYPRLVPEVDELLKSVGISTHEEESSINTDVQSYSSSARVK